MLNRMLNLLVIGFLAAGLTICLIVGGCDVPVPTLTGTVPMKCVWGFSCVSALLAFGLILAFVRLFLKTTEARRFAALSLGLLALAAALIPSPLIVGLCSWDGSALCCAHLVEAGATAEELAWCGLTMDCHISAIVLWSMMAMVVISVIIQAVLATSGSAEEHKPKLYE